MGHVINMSRDVCVHSSGHPRVGRVTGWHGVPFTRYGVQCTMYDVQYTAYNVQCKPYNVQCTPYIAQCTACNIDVRHPCIHTTYIVSRTTADMSQDILYDT